MKKDGNPEDRGAVLKATHMGEMKLGDSSLQCAVLEDGSRVLSERGVMRVIGRKHGGRELSSGADKVPRYLAGNNIKPFIPSDLLAVLNSPILYSTGKGGGVAYGIEATLLPRICEVWLNARDAGALRKQQLHIAEKAGMLIRAFAKVGIIALIDEATGFQVDRGHDALHKLLSLYLTEERLAWAKRFPDEFYKQIYRLKKWQWPPASANKRTPLVGQITNTVVYERLPNGVLEKLQELNPTDKETRRRKWKHHQFLSPEIGQPDLRDHILQVLPLMRISKSWEGFLKMLDRALPMSGTQMTIDDDLDLE